MKNDMSRRDLSLALTLALSWQIFPSIAMAQAQTSSQSNSEEIVGLRAILVRETRSENGVEMWELTFDAESAARSPVEGD